MEKIHGDKVAKICNEIFALEGRKGHLKWTVTELARKCKVSKSLVYYHFGKSKTEIFNSSFETVSRELWGLTREREAMISEGRLLDSMLASHKMHIETPEFTVFYFRYRHSPSAIGERIRDYDRQYQERLKRVFPHFSTQELAALQAMFHGLVISPIAHEEAFKFAVQWLTPVLRSRP